MYVLGTSATIHSCCLVNRDGVFVKAELHRLITKALGLSYTERQSNAVFRYFDVDRDGRLSATEMIEDLTREDVREVPESRGSISTRGSSVVGSNEVGACDGQPGAIKMYDGGAQKIFRNASSSTGQQGQGQQAQLLQLAQTRGPNGFSFETSSPAASWSCRKARRRGGATSWSALQVG